MENLLKEIEQLKVEYEDFNKGNKSAGKRARKILQSIRKLAFQMRIEIQEKRKSEKTK